MKDNKKGLIMSMFFCDGCSQCLDSDESGYHETCYGGFECDDCESVNHRYELKNVLKEFLENLHGDKKNEK